MSATICASANETSAEPIGEPLEAAAPCRYDGRLKSRGGRAAHEQHMKRAFVFPGQGSQTPGMGQALAEAFPTARHLFEEVDEALSQSLSRLMFEGPESELTLTE